MSGSSTRKRNRNRNSGALGGGAGPLKALAIADASSVSSSEESDVAATLPPAEVPESDVDVEDKSDVSVEEDDDEEVVPVKASKKRVAPEDPEPRAAKARRTSSNGPLAPGYKRRNLTSTSLSNIDKDAKRLTSYMANQMASITDRDAHQKMRAGGREMAKRYAAQRDAIRAEDREDSIFVQAAKGSIHTPLRVITANHDIISPLKLSTKIKITGSSSALDGVMDKKAWAASGWVPKYLKAARSLITTHLTDSAKEILPKEGSASIAEALNQLAAATAVKNRSIQEFVYKLDKGSATSGKVVVDYHVHANHVQMETLKYDDADVSGYLDTVDSKELFITATIKGKVWNEGLAKGDAAKLVAAEKKLEAAGGNSKALGYDAKDIRAVAEEIKYRPVDPASDVQIVIVLPGSQLAVDLSTKFQVSVSHLFVQAGKYSSGSRNGRIPLCTGAMKRYVRQAATSGGAFLAQLGGSSKSADYKNMLRVAVNAAMFMGFVFLYGGYSDGCNSASGLFGNTKEFAKIAMGLAQPGFEANLDMYDAEGYDVTDADQRMELKRMNPEKRRGVLKLKADYAAAENRAGRYGDKRPEIFKDGEWQELDDDEPLINDGKENLRCPAGDGKRTLKLKVHRNRKTGRTTASCVSAAVDSGSLTIDRDTSIFGRVANVDDEVAKKAIRRQRILGSFATGVSDETVDDWTSRTAANKVAKGEAKTARGKRAAKLGHQFQDVERTVTRSQRVLAA